MKLFLKFSVLVILSYIVVIILNNNNDTNGEKILLEHKIDREKNRILLLNKLNSNKKIQNLSVQGLDYNTLCVLIGKYDCDCSDELFLHLKKLQIHDLVFFIHNDKYNQYKGLLNNLKIQARIIVFFNEDFPYIKKPYFFYFDEEKKYKNFFIYDNYNFNKFEEYINEI